MTISRITDFAPCSTPEDTFKFDDSRSDIELQVYMPVLRKTGGKVLDLAAGNLRNSLLFAENDMDVTAVDVNGQALAAGLERIADQATRQHIRPWVADARDYGRRNLEDGYDAVLVSEYLSHAGSLAAALETARLAYDNVLPGGHLWIRTVGTLDDGYKRLQYAADLDPNVRSIEDHQTFYASCNCSGEHQIEPQTFLQPYDLHGALELDNSQIVYERLHPTKGYPNIMGGAALATSERADTTYGQISLLVRKSS